MSGGSALFPERPSRVLAIPFAFSNVTGFWDRLCSGLGVSESVYEMPLATWVSFSHPQVLTHAVQVGPWAWSGGG